MDHHDRCKRYILLSAIGTLLILGTLIFMSIPIKEYIDTLRLTQGENLENIKDVSAIMTQSVTTKEVEEMKRQYLNDSNTVNTRLSFCKNRDLKALQLGGLFLFTDPPRKMGYCEVPKAASTTWRHAFTAMNSIRKDGIEAQGNRNILFSKKYSIQANNSSDLTRLNQTNILKMIIVRHPFERIGSAYHDKFVVQRKVSRPSEKFIGIVDRVRNHQTKEMNISSTDPCLLNASVQFPFPCFVEYVLHRTMKPLYDIFFRFDVHWWPYTELCRVCSVHYDFVGHVERLQEDIEILSNKFPENDVLEDLHQKKVKAHCTASCKNTTNEVYIKYFHEITKDTIIRLYFRFFDDFKFGGYEFPRNYITAGLDNE